MTINAYVWNDIPNWGDQLGHCLLQLFLGAQVQKVEKIRDADIVGIGSVLHHIPTDWAGVIAGAGSLKPLNKLPPKATVLGLRGYLSVDFWHASIRSDVVYGDPALMMPLILSDTVTEEADIGILPHWSDTALRYDSRFYGPWTTKVISPFWEPFRVVREIMSCKKLVTSSLHGVIVADAYDIPRRIVPAWSMNNNPYEGGMFKFADYMSVLNMPYEPEVLDSPDRLRVEEVQDEIYTMYRTLPELFDDINKTNIPSNT